MRGIFWLVTMAELVVASSLMGCLLRAAKMRLSEPLERGEMRYVNGILGMLFFGLGAIGVIIPILPTTPFLLLASFFFLRSSKRLNDWFVATYLYKRFIANYMETRSLTLRSKFLCASPGVIAMTGLAIILPQWWAKAIFAALTLFEIWYFIFRIKTISSQEARARGRQRVRDCTLAASED